MLAIVAFSFGLAAVLVGIGLTFALIRPVWLQFRTTSAGRSGRVARVGSLATRLAVVMPLVSASAVLTFGLLMLWTAASSS